MLRKIKKKKKDEVRYLENPCVKEETEYKQTGKVREGEKKWNRRKTDIRVSIETGNQQGSEHIYLYLKGKVIFICWLPFYFKMNFINALRGFTI